MKRLSDFLTEPALINIKADGSDRYDLHRKILHKKCMLRSVFVEFHHLFNNLSKRYFLGEGLEVELGSGISPIRDSYPNVLATDIVPANHLDKVINAEKMDFKDKSVRVIFGQNCFHHFPHPDIFFSELERVIVPGGGCILIEPYYGSFASFLYKHLFRTEGFDKSYRSWNAPITGPLNGANQALSYIVFVRDRNSFLKKHPTLEIVHHERLGNYLRYLISGGLNFRQLLPDSLTSMIRLLEKFLWPFSRFFSLHHIIVIRKKVK